MTKLMTRFLRKTSVLLVSSILFSMMAPVVSYAASVMYFVYRPAPADVYMPDPELTGYIYTRDPNSVSVQASGPSTVTNVTYNRVYADVMYDDNNTPYALMQYNFRLGTAPTDLTVNSEGASYQLSGTPDPDYPDVNSYTMDLSANLDSTYRMPGQNYMSTVTAATYLAAGTDIASFSPSVYSISAIRIILPNNDSTRASILSQAVEANGSDFEIIDRATQAVVPFNRLESDPEAGEFTFVLVNMLQKDHEYLIKFSSTSSGEEVMLPTDGRYTAAISLGYWDGVSFNERNIAFFRNLTIGNPPAEPEPSIPPSDPAPVPVPYTPPVVPGPVTPPGTDQVVVNEESLNNGTKDKVAVEIANGKKQVLLPVKAADIVGGRSLELSNDQLSVEIPSDVLQKLKNLVPSDQLANAQMSFSMDPVNESDTSKLLGLASNLSNTQLKAAGDVYEFKLSIITAGGNSIALSRFDEPITLRLKVRDGANPALLGIYYIADNGALEYVGGQLIDGELVAKVKHFSKYAVLEFNKTFEDVPEQLWASAAIKELAAKHIISGENDRSFAPDKQMTRGEFAALISRALGLKASNQAAFSDVGSGNVHAEAIAAVYEAGIFQGRTQKTFAPNDRITREEMVTTIMKAYEYKSGKKVNSAVQAEYTDRLLAEDWALPYLDAAVSMGLVKGKGNGKFAPKQWMTRAEGAQMIYQLLKSN
jgi:hypothetical protein